MKHLLKQEDSISQANRVVDTMVWLETTGNAQQRFEMRQKLEDLIADAIEIANSEIVSSRKSIGDVNNDPHDEVIISVVGGSWDQLRETLDDLGVRLKEE